MDASRTDQFMQGAGFRFRSPLHTLRHRQSLAVDSLVINNPPSFLSPTSSPFSPKLCQACAIHDRPVLLSTSAICRENETNTSHPLARCLRHRRSSVKSSPRLPQPLSGSLITRLPQLPSLRHLPSGSRRQTRPPIKTTSITPHCRRPRRPSHPRSPTWTPKMTLVASCQARSWART